jgi:hypothetical protein
MIKEMSYRAFKNWLIRKANDKGLNLHSENRKHVFETTGNKQIITRFYFNLAIEGIYKTFEYVYIDKARVTCKLIFYERFGISSRSKWAFLNTYSVFLKF